ncbi:hypothetical protein O181_043176 [Austropuccinia psidii MF-1]|uniref:Uncharacterized protein n=1 Tax=Austropuccinia psidii MF-1 TaxID=1389203 RepID=A0A9Q3DG60_9BASI|nr:hypothetical protein [Austropuccinia psidii MF-1]
MAEPSGKSYQFFHSSFNSTEASNQMTGRIWIKFFSSTTPQRLIPMEHGQQEVQPRFKLGRTWGRLLGNMSQRDTLKRPYGNNQRLESQQEVQTPGGKGSQDKG